MLPRLRIAAPTFALLSLVFALSFMRISDFDVWWHLACGKLLLRDGLIPRKEIFSYTASGRPWVDGYLLAQAAMYVVWLIGGPWGISLLGGVLSTAAFSLAFAMSRWGVRGRPLGYGAALLAALPAAYSISGVVMPRPALLTPVFALLTLWLLEEHRLHGGKRIWWVLPMMVLWGNCHPGFLLGPLFTAVYFVGALRQPPAARRRLALLLVGQLLAVLINPYGYWIYYSAFSLLGNTELRNTILEWKPLFSSPPEWPGVIPAFLTVSALGLICFAVNWKRARAEHFLLFAILAIMAVAGRRNRLQFGPVSVVLISWIVSATSGKAAKSARWPLRWLQGRALAGAGATVITLAALFMTWFAGTNRLFFYTRIFQSAGCGIHPAFFPEGAVNILNREPIKGNIFHDYSLGGYFMFRLYPQYRVFIDGRIYPYPLDILHSEQNALDSWAYFENIGLKYDARAVMLHISQRRTRLLLQALLLSDRWAVVYADGKAVLFLMRGAGNDDIIARREINVFKGLPALPPPQDERGFPFNQVEYPYGQMWWAGFYEQAGRPDLAVQTLSPVLGIRPPVKNLELWYGALLIDAGELERGIGYLQKAPDSKNIAALSAALAEYWVAKKDFSRAEEILADMMIRGSGTPEFYRAYGELQHYRGNMQAAADFFRKAVEYRPYDGRLWEELGMALQKSDAAGARDALGRALAYRSIVGGSPQELQRIRAELEDVGRK